MPQDQPNVLFLLSDQHSYQYTEHQTGDDSTAVQTPTLDALAQTSTVFENTYCPVPLCTPSRMCLLSGREAQRCGAWENWHRLDPAIPTLPGTLSAAGYETCLVGKMHLGGNRQFVGFDHRPYGDLTGRTGHQSDPPVSYWEKDTPNLVYGQGVTGIPESMLQEANVVQESVSFLREFDHSNPDQPWFLCASFSRPHGPMTAPRRHIERHPPSEVPPPTVWPDSVDHPSIEGDDRDREEMLTDRGAYFACVDYLDEVIGDLLTTLERDNLLEDTIIIYTSDHGEMAGEHGQTGKKLWFEDSTRVPLMIQTPAQRQGNADSNRIETPVGLVDLFPTICSLCDVDHPEGLDGHDLVTAVQSDTEPDRDPVVCDFFTSALGGSEYRMVRDGRYKYIQFSDHPELLFDLKADPHEQTNLAVDPDEDAADSLERLREFVEDTIDFDIIDAVRRRDEEVLTDHELGVPGATDFVNAYHLPDGRIVEAETPLYRPHVIAEDPSKVYPDWPDSDR